MGLRLEGRLRSRAFRFKFEFAAFQRLVGRPQGRLQALDLLDALPVLSRLSLEQLAGFVEFPLVGLLPRLPSLGPLLFRLLQSLFGFLEGALAFLDRLQGRLRFEGSFRCRAGGLPRSRFALSDAGFARRQRGFAVREVLRLGAQFRELGLEHGFPLTQLSGLSGALPTLVDFVLETRALRSRLIDRSSRLREFSGNLLLSILTLSSGGLRFRLRGFEASHQLRDVFPRDVEIFLEGAGSIRLRLDGRLRPGDFRLDLEFAAFQRFIGGPQRRLQTRDFLDALRVFSLSSLEKLAGFVEFPHTRLLLGFRSFRPLAFRLLQSLFGFLEGALAFLDRLQGRLRFEGSFRSRTGDLVRRCFALSDAGFVRSECGIAVSEILRSGVEPCELGFQVGFLPAQFSCLSCALKKLVDLFLEACDFSLLFLDCTSCLGEFAVDRLFLILKLAARSVRFRSDGLQGAYRLRKVFSRGIEVFLEGAGSIRLRLEGRLRASDLGFEFDFAALQGFAGRLKGCPQTFGFLGPLGNLRARAWRSSRLSSISRARASSLTLFCSANRSAVSSTFFSVFSAARSRSLIALSAFSASSTRSAASRDAFSDSASRASIWVSLPARAASRSARAFARPSSFDHWALRSDSFSVSSPALPARFRSSSTSSFRRATRSFSWSAAFWAFVSSVVSEASRSLPSRRADCVSARADSKFRSIFARSFRALSRSFSSSVVRLSA